MTCRILSQLPLSSDLLVMFRICLDAETTSSTITDYRDKLQLLQKLSYESIQLSIIKYPEYRLVSLMFYSIASYLLCYLSSFAIEVNNIWNFAGSSVFYLGLPLHQFSTTVGAPSITCCVLCNGNASNWILANFFWSIDFSHRTTRFFIWSWNSTNSKFWL